MALTPRRSTGGVRGGRAAFSAARDRTGWHGQGASERQEQAPTRLYDQRGDGLRDGPRLDAVLDDADDAVWLVPAMALTESIGEAAADRQVSSVSATQELDCETCGRATDHRFKTRESLPDEAWTGQLIWECRGVARLATAPVSSSSSAGRRLTNILREVSGFVG